MPTESSSHGTPGTMGLIDALGTSAGCRAVDRRVPGGHQRFTAECARRSEAALAAGCVALLHGRHDEVDDGLVRTLGVGPAEYVLSGGEGGKQGYWPRVWGARGLLCSCAPAGLPEPGRPMAVR